MDPFLGIAQHNKLIVDEKLTMISLYEEEEESEKNDYYYNFKLNKTKNLFGID